MERLSHSSVWRGGSLGHTVAKQDPLPAVGSVICPGTDGLSLGTALHFQMPAGGRGHSDVMVWISPEDFEAIAHAMISADPAAARRAFGRALVADAEARPVEDI